MKQSFSILLVLFAFTFVGCKEKSNDDTLAENTNTEQFFIGKWYRVTPNGTITINFKEDGFVETNFGSDRSIDVTSQYKVSNDTIEFFNEKGKACPDSGVYKIYNRGYSISFDVLDDLCNGRIKTTAGFWVRPNYKELMSELNSKIKRSDSIEYALNRGRMYLALGKSKLAKQDFDVYLAKDSLNPKVFIHRAATRFPFDLDGVVSDCNRSIVLESTDKYAYFLRGLALYELGEEQNACNDFQKAIDLGFTILKQAEKNKCEAFWKE